MKKNVNVCQSVLKLRHETFFLSSLLNKQGGRKCVQRKADITVDAVGEVGVAGDGISGRKLCDFGALCDVLKFKQKKFKTNSAKIV